MSFSHHSVDNEAKRLLRKVYIGKMNSNPILKAINPKRIADIQKEFGTDELKSNYRKLSFDLHPDSANRLSDLKPKELEACFGFVTEIYQTLIERKAMPSVPYTIPSGLYNEIDAEEISLRRFNIIYSSADAEIWKRDNNNPLGWNRFKEHWKVPMQLIHEGVEAYLEAERSGTVAEGLGETEVVLRYGFCKDDCHWPYTIHPVALTHLESAGAFDAPPDEWILIDKGMSCDTGLIRDEEGNIVRHATSMSVVPSTFTMTTEEGHMFFIRNPYQKRVIRKGDVLVPIEGYTEAGRTDIMIPEEEPEPIETNEGVFESYGKDWDNTYLPWSVLSPDSIETLRDLGKKHLEKERSSLPYRA